MTSSPFVYVYGTTTLTSRDALVAEYNGELHVAYGEPGLIILDPGPSNVWKENHGQ